MGCFVCGKRRRLCVFILYLNTQKCFISCYRRLWSVALLFPKSQGHKFCTQPILVYWFLLYTHTFEFFSFYSLVGLATSKVSTLSSNFGYIHMSRVEKYVYLSCIIHTIRYVQSLHLQSDPNFLLLTLLVLQALLPDFHSHTKKPRARQKIKASGLNSGFTRLLPPTKRGSACRFAILYLLIFFFPNSIPFWSM